MMKTIDEDSALGATWGTDTHVNGLSCPSQTLSKSEPLSPQILSEENRRYFGTVGISQNSQQFGFRPAFRDNQSGCIYLSTYSDGRLAPIHVLEGLPDHLVLKRSDDGHIAAVKPCVESGFLKSGSFYSRQEACQEMQRKK